MAAVDQLIYEDVFLNDSEKGRIAYGQAVHAAQRVISENIAGSSQPYSGASPERLADMFRDLAVCPEEGDRLKEVVESVGDTIVKHSVMVSDPRCMAHLHCPVTIPALAAEMIISATNQSMDSWDQSPAATYVEEAVVKWLCSLFGYKKEGDGVFTSGGTQSNYLGILLARDQYCKKNLNWNVQKNGLPPEAPRLRILCSEHAHFTVRQSAAQLGLGEEAVVTVDTDKNQQMSAKALQQKMNELRRQGLLPFAMVATAGTTDFGSIDPLNKLAEVARQQNIWFHVDAAYGGALALSDRHSHKLAGIAEADSITADFHKLFYQPISCGVFLLKERDYFDLMKLNADYLNPEEDQEDGIINLVGKSTQTTRRFDALKLFMTLQTFGRLKFAEMIDRTIDMAQQTAALIALNPNFELFNDAEMSTVVFRYKPERFPEAANRMNRAIQRALLYGGKAVVAKTKVAGEVFLKLTILNPGLTIETVKQIIDDIVSLGRTFEHEEESGTFYGEKQGNRRTRDYAKLS